MVTVTDLTDIQLDSDRQIFLDSENDVATVSGIENVEQSVAILSSEALRPLIGEPLSTTSFERIQTQLTAQLQKDIQIDGIERVTIVGVDRQNGTVELDVFVSNNENFSLNVDVSGP